MSSLQHSILNSSNNNSRFSDEDIQLAKKVQDVYGVPVSVTLAQYALESGYGRHTSGRNNYFGVKGNGRNGYKDYSSKEESFMHYGEILSKDRYTSRTNSARNVREYVQGVKDGGYAEDPNYVDKIMRVIQSNNLDSDFPYDNTRSNVSVSGGSVVNTSTRTDLVWWGDIVRVVVILLLVGGSAVLLATSVGGIGSIKSAVISKAIKGATNGE